MTCRIALDAPGPPSAIEILQPAGTAPLTPASHVALRAIAGHQTLLHGTGLDWGTGTGCLAAAAATLPAVDWVIGLELSEAGVAAARGNVARNNLEEKVTIILADSYSPLSTSDRQTLDALAGRVDFVLANPPASTGDDGFGYRRAVLRGAREYLTQGGIVFLNISYQYGPQRIAALCTDAPGFTHGGVLATTDWVPFDLRRPDLLECLELYADEERRGGLAYTFRSHAATAEDGMNAQTALAAFHATGRSPLSRWQTHLFRFDR